MKVPDLNDEGPPTKLSLRIKAATIVLSFGAVVWCALSDWDQATGGRRHVFSDVKPTLKKFFNELYGVSPVATSVGDLKSELDAQLKNDSTQQRR